MAIESLAHSMSGFGRRRSRSVREVFELGSPLLEVSAGVATRGLDVSVSEDLGNEHEIVRVIAHAREIASAAVFLASDESSYVTASTFMVDGGISGAYVTPE